MSPGIVVAVRIPGVHRGAHPGADDGQLRHLRAHGAVVLDRLAGVDAALELQARAEPRADVEQHAVVALILLADVVGEGDVVAGLAELALERRCRGR